MVLLRPLIVSIFALTLIALSGCGGNGVEGLYDVYTDDGINLKLRRYRPDSDERFNNTTPVVLFPGILLNMNQYLAHTPDAQKRAYSSMTLPDHIADWAVGDDYIEDDPMMYYSLAHYLWSEGYDVWMVNYRGIGRGDFESEKGNNRTNLDVWAALDAPAAIDAVIDITGKKPVIGGHSTGGLVSYLYLQGVYMDADAVEDGDYVPHMQSSAALARERNRNVAGFLGIDPAGVPPLPFEALLDNPLIWSILSQRWYVDFDYVVGEIIMPLLPPVLTSGTVSLIFTLVSEAADAFPRVLPEYLDLFGALNVWQVDNMNRYTEDYVGRMTLSSLYLRIISQYADWGINGSFREHWMNGEENKTLINPPSPSNNDGYFNYGDHMDRMTVPALSFFSESSGAVDTETMVEILYDGKTFHPHDEWMEITGTGHVDIPLGDDAPGIMFPAIGEWMEGL